MKETNPTLYEKKKKFSLLITLFLKIYDKNKDLCIKLMDVFEKINEKENTDKDKDLGEHLETFKQIYSNSDVNEQKNGYDPIKFYGILFCYLSHFDENEFPNIIKKFYEGNNDILFEILTIYYSHFKNPLNQDSKFYNDFIKYIIKTNKESNLLERALNYIDDTLNVLKPCMYESQGAMVIDVAKEDDNPFANEFLEFGTTPYIGLFTEHKSIKTMFLYTISLQRYTLFMKKAYLRKLKSIKMQISRLVRERLS